MKLSKQEILVLLSISVLLFVFGLILMQRRWINPDEGAHIADAQLLLSGKVPLVDYMSRQPLYVLLISVFLKIFGISFLSARLLPLISTIGLGILIYLIAKKSSDKTTGLTALIIFAFFPFTILYMTIVKMNVVMMFWGCLAILFYILYNEKNRIIYLLLCGIFLGFAYYIRESSLTFLITVLVTIFLTNGKKFIATLTQWLIVVSAFFMVVLVVFAFYINYMTLIEFWNSPLNPFYQLIGGISKIAAFAGIHIPTESSFQLKLEAKDHSSSYQQFRQIFRMNLYLFAGFLLYWIYLLKEFLTTKKKVTRNYFTVYLLPTWLITTFLVYGYYFFARGFFPSYALELFPQLLLCLSYLLTEKLIQNRLITIKLVLFFILIAYAVMAIQKFFNIVPDFSVYFSGAFALTFIYWFSKENLYKVYKSKFITSAILFLCIAFILQSNLITGYIGGKVSIILLLLILLTALFYFKRRNLIDGQKMFTKYFATTVLVALLIGSAGECGKHLKLFSYDCAWSAKTAKKATTFIEKNSNKDDTLFSGGMIWTVNSQTRPYLNITHPTTYLSIVDEEFSRKLKNNLAVNPPSFIVLDGYTQKCFSFLGQSINDLVTKKYSLAHGFNENGNPVQIFVKH